MEVKKLSYSYKKSFSLKNVTFKVESGDILGILGSNGSGKTTLLKNILGILRGEGSILFKNMDLRSRSLEEKKNIISYVPQESQINNLTVYETIMLGRIPYMGHKEKEEDKEIVNDMIKKFKLENLSSRKVTSLSGGERQRTYIARALAQNSQILVMDEPTSSLDIANAVYILKIIKEIVKEKKLRCIIIIHDLGLASKFCNKFLFLKNGRQIYFGEREDSFKKEIIEELYEMEMNIYNAGEEYFISPRV